MRFILLILIASVLFGTNVNKNSSTDTSRMQEAATNVINWKIKSNDDVYLNAAGSTNADWFIIGLNGNSNSWKHTTYLDNLKAKVATPGNYNATDWYRMAISLTCCGEDAGEIVKKYTYNGEKSFIGRQGLNSYIWANIALQSVSDTSEAAKKFMQSTALLITGKQLKDGSYSLAGTVGDVDLTAMAIVGLSSFYQKDDNITTSINKSLKYLSDVQHANGGFSSGGKENSSSIAQVIIAISTLGINPTTDARFCKDVSALDALLSYQNTDGSFSNYKEDKIGNNMASDQALLALDAAMRAEENTGFVYSYLDKFSN